jgi:hypothetical protein
MSFLHPFTKSSEHPENAIVLQGPESVGTILGKISIVWAGLFAGISLGDVVLVATLIYTLLQIGLAVYERIIRPIRAARAEVAVLKVAMDANTAARISSEATSSTGQSGSQEK